MHEKVEGLWERTVRLCTVWVCVEKRNVARADVKRLMEAVVLKDVRLEVSRCVLFWLDVDMGSCSIALRFEAMETPTP